MRFRRPLWPIVATAILLSALPLRADDLPAPAPKFLRAWGRRGDKPGEFYSPIHIAINRHDEIFVADLNNSRVQKFSTEGEYLGGFDLPPDTPPKKSCIVGGLAVDGDSQLYVAFMNQHRVAVYDPSGKVVREWGKRGDGDGEFFTPGGIVLAKNGTVYVADQNHHRVQMFTTDGKFLGKFGEHGSEPGQFGGMENRGSRFAGPHFLSQDSKGRLYTTEGVMGRIQQLSPEGRPLLAWGNKTDDPGGFGSYQFGSLKNTFGPVGVFVDHHDRVWVSSLNDRVQCFTADGKFLFGIETTGKKDGELAKPHGMALDSKGHFYIADAGNQRILKFEIPAP